MDRVFVDTNVLLDYLAARTPFDAAAKSLAQRAEKGQIELCASTLSLCNIAYILRKLVPRTNIPSILTDLSALLTFTSIDGAVIADALQSDFSDFEDAVQHFSATHHGGITHLITRNPIDFTRSLIPVFTPEDYLLANP
jgi:predicted nucleic acid-binding protein